MGKRRGIDPEVRAEWERERREMRRLLEVRLARDRELRERESRRRSRLRRLTFGLLGR